MLTILSSKTDTACSIILFPEEAHPRAKPWRATSSLNYRKSVRKHGFMLYEDAGINVAERQMGRAERLKDEKDQKRCGTNGGLGPRAKRRGPRVKYEGLRTEDVYSRTAS